MTSEEGASEQSSAEAVFAAWALRVENGEKLEFESLVREYPALEAELRGLYDDWKLYAPLLGKAVPGLIASADGFVSPSLSGPDADEGTPTDELYARLGIRIPEEGRYRFRAVMGRGGGGVVLRVWDSKLSRPLAMKIILGPSEDRPTGQTPKVDSRTLSRFVDEARIASQLNHPGIVPVHELGADETGRAFFTMKLVKGDDLSKIFEKVRTGKDGWNEPRALAVLLRVCEAMAYAHDKGVIHRDLKPANVMVGSYEEVHVMDWGLARVVGENDHRDLRIPPPARGAASVVGSVRRRDSDATEEPSLLTTDGTFMGTPSYMSPEQANGEIEKVGALADVYGVGATLYELLAGEPPYLPRGQRLPQLEVVKHVVDGPPRRVEEIAPRAAPELVAICERAMAREPRNRYPSMRDLAADLRAFLEGRVVAAYETGAWAETRKWVRRNRALAASVAALVLVLTAGLASTLVTKSRLAEASRIAQSNEAEAKSNAYFAAVIGAQAAHSANEPASIRRLLDSAPEAPRNWEWRYLKAVSDTSLMTVEGHADAVRCATFSPDGLYILTASDDKTARVWDATTGQELLRLDGHSDAVVFAAFSPDQRVIVTASSDGTARTWDVRT
ncbi:MAG: protein kinase, partial [Planctomycetes bacterium]|nr:protein kinase [Planctomycetota bacterium]